MQERQYFMQNYKLNYQNDDQSVINQVTEIKLWYPDTQPNRPILIVFLLDSSVFLYQNMPCFTEKSEERFRFKLIDSQVLIKPRCLVDQSFSREIIHIDGKMVLILHPTKTFGVFIRHGRPILVDIGKHQGSSFISLAPFMTGFLAINEQQNAVRSLKFPARFDPRAPSTKLADGYFLKQLLFKDRGIKKIKLFNPIVASTNLSDNNPPLDQSREYIFLATYEHKTPVDAIPGNNGGFLAETRAPSIFYTLEVLKMPKAGGQWKEFSDQFLLDKVIKEPFQENQVINQLEQITLRSTTDDFRNYLAVASVRIDTSLQRRGAHAQRQDDEGFYSSALHIFQVQPEQNKLKVCFLENYKRSITCVSSYLGNLIATMKNQKMPDLVFIMYRFNEITSKLTNPAPIPNGVQNLATSISFDGDYIIVGDAYKNLNLLKKCDEEDNKQERQESSGLINFKKVMTNKIEANVIGAYSLNKKLGLSSLDQAIHFQNGVMSHKQIIPLTEIQKKLFTVISASFDGYVRLYKIKETKNLEIVAQINVMDKILSTIPLELNSFKMPNTQSEQMASNKEQLLASIAERKFALVTQRNGILITSPCIEIEYRAQKSLIELISRVVPHRGCLTPMHSHLTPTTVFVEKSSIFQRTNSNAVNYSKSLYLYFFLSQTQKLHIASKIGFTVPKMESFIFSQKHSMPEITQTAATTTQKGQLQRANI